MFDTHTLIMWWRWRLFQKTIIRLLSIAVDDIIINLILKTPPNEIVQKMGIVSLWKAKNCNDVEENF